MTKNQLSLKLRQNSRKDYNRKILKSTSLCNKSDKKTNETGGGGLIFPAGDTAFKTLLSARFCSAIWSHISDCDETFNYWEPMHYLVFGKGLQTWEYSPEFALRSYFYLMFHAVPAWVYYKILNPNPLLMFYFVRCLLGLMCAFSEVYFYKAVCKEFGVHIGRMCLAFLIFSPGMFISSTAFLPSTFAMYTVTAACAAWWQQKFALAVFFTALGTLLGWPFAALLGVPIAFDMLYRRKKYIDFLMWSALSASVILVPMVIIDSSIFGKLVIAPLNIVMYNVFGESGPNLYGTEPFSFYLLNGILNFNFVWVFALFCPIALVLGNLFVPSKHKSTLYLPHWLSLSPLYLWLVVFMIQAHKEERFLFPVYPLICLTGAISIDILQKLTFRLWNLVKKVPPGTHYLDKTTFVMIFFITISSVLGVSRIFALYKNYHAPFDLMMELNRFPNEMKISDRAQVNVCWGKDWHRHPSSFFLPNNRWNVHFVKSEFDGMLPTSYSGSANATQIVHNYFNDKNKEEPSLYFDVNKCHFLLDLNTGEETSLEPIYANMKDKWKLIRSYPFLNAKKSNTFFRAFYIPFLSGQYIEFGNFTLLQNIKYKIR